MPRSRPHPIQWWGGGLFAVCAVCALVWAAREAWGTARWGVAGDLSAAVIVYIFRPVFGLD